MITRRGCSGKCHVSLQFLWSAAEWRRWEAVGSDPWREHKRQSWAEELLEAQQRRRLEREQLRFVMGWWDERGVPCLCLSVIECGDLAMLMFLLAEQSYPQIKRGRRRRSGERRGDSSAGALPATITSTNGELHWVFAKWCRHVARRAGSLPPLKMLPLTGNACI